MNIDIGITADHRGTIIKGLEKVLADTYTLYLKSHNFHWNITGMAFKPLHELFETQYRELAEAVDTVAERIRLLGGVAPASYSAFSRLTCIEDSDGSPGAKAMLQELVEGNEAVVKTCRSVIRTAAEGGDDGTEDLLIARIRTHEKAAWMLRSHLQ